MLGGTIQENLAKFPHCILLTRVGQFYEVRNSPSVCSTILTIA